MVFCKETYEFQPGDKKVPLNLQKQEHQKCFHAFNWGITDKLLKCLQICITDFRQIHKTLWYD
jgi:hypothetical protein